MNPNDDGWDPCKHRWYATDSPTWSHRCVENGDHEEHRCCCGATEPRRVDA